MSVRVLAVLVLAICPLWATADDVRLIEARTRWLKGNGAEAKERYAALAGEPKHAVAAALGLSRVAEATGEYDAALKYVDEAIQTHDAAELHARRAELLYARGRWEDATVSVDKALKLNDEQFTARWVQAQLLRDRGEDEKADAAYRWFVRAYVARNRANQDIKDPEQLLIVGMAGAENARRHNLTDQYRFILNEVYADALRAEPSYWPAELQAGLLLLEKYNKPQALAAFDKALAINPRAAAAFVGKGRIALQHFELAEADEMANRALAINPRLPEAVALSIDVALAAGDDAGAADRIKDALAFNPRDEGVLGREAALAALHPRTGAAVAEVTKRVKAFNPKPGHFYYEMARRLDDRRRYAAAREGYRQALEYMPKLTAARTELGLLALRMGEEAEAKSLLTEAFKSDPFHVRVSNSLKVLRVLDGYATIKTPHFIVRFDAKNDGALARLAAEMLEAEYEKLAAEYEHRPVGPILFEIFPRHELFSGRVIAAPDLHTIGATTGRVFAMASPHAEGVRKPFNWARVIRHELTHIFNLDQTHFLSPHWLTEGLAVANEGFARPPEWGRLLAASQQSHDLLDLKRIDLGFTRPRSQEENTLAYCQAQLYVEYLVQRHGPKTVKKLLQAYRDGADLQSAIKSATGGDVSAVETGYKAHVEQTVRQAGLAPPMISMSLAQLEAAHAKKPDDLEVAARLAEQYVRRRRAADARELVDAVLAKDAKHGLALAVKAQMLIDSGDEEAAYNALSLVAEGEKPFPKALRAFGQIQLKAGRTEEAIATFERGHKLEPGETVWLAEIARASRQAGDVEKQIKVMMDLLRGDADNIDDRRELAKMLFDLERYPEAEKYARESIEIDPVDRTSQDLLIRALRSQRKVERADYYEKLFNHPGKQ